MRLIFFGTPAVAVPYLELLARRGEVVAAISRPDKPAGRGLAVESTPVKQAARRLGIPVFQPQRPSEIADELKTFKPDLAVCVAYGKILKPDVLAVPKLGTLNVHFSLLPRYRGAAPAQWSLIKGEARTGVTIFWLDEGMDTGPVFLAKETPVGPDEDAGELLERLRKLGGEALDEVLSEIAQGRLRREPQKGESSLAPPLKSGDAKIFLDKSALEIHNLVRGLRLGPRPYLTLKSGRLLVHKTALPDAAGTQALGRPGQILRVERGKGFLIQCSSGSALWLVEVQPEGKKPQSASDFLNGRRLGPGDFLPIEP